jgi:hypothetical protein
MACRSRVENSRRNPVPRASWTVDEFCASVGISRSTYERAKREGWGPREMLLGSTGIRIADESVAHWIADREEQAAKLANRRRQREIVVKEVA